ncbi:lysine N(6)-hydroxylase/L-ornithine N(5)-oxygenase family protein [Acinetobacter sp. MF4640]|uniref:lysine N(6)-hydroxylase/L-ornithine N(5)-oxygenase family protein n=1 Tax=Acinetobacter sp. MF4640 TaxID=1960826 RepID=UPI00099543B0|nr:SidA/IucD/PvdA family monooxygenase [Acinetobacter sp. MF4640]OOW12652.1 ornithine monooxygenase [Acinetobacter sp. MF4640]
MLDFIAIGLGPFNLSLASLLHEKTELNYLFFEKKAQFDWHAGMQLPNTVLQVPFMADLVSMVDPTSPLSFLNYLKSQQRLYKFYFLEQPHIPRREYNHYCQWVADQLGHIQYKSMVKAIYAKNEGFEVVVEQGGRFIRYLCRNLVIGSGNQPYLPECLRKLQQQVPEKCIDSADYLTHKKDKLKGNVVVLGSGQSSAEVFLDLFDQQYQHDCVPTANFKLHWLTRSNGFFPMEYAPLGLEHFSPNYTQHFYRLSETQKAAQLKDQALLYKGISAKTIREIYQKLYHRSIASAIQATHLHAQIQLLDAELLESQQIRLSLEHTVTEQRFYMEVDFVVASTGYYSPEFSFLKYLKPLITTDQAGRWTVSQDYRLQHTAMGEIYVQNQEMHSHGVGTPDLGLGAFRAATIANQLLGYQLYELDSNEETFQHFNTEQNPEMYVQNDTSITRTAALAPSIPKSKNIEQRKIQTGVHPSMQPYTFEKII